ncbi:cyclic lactone autoinducer peptide [Agathobacter rectalis]|jgi:AgrD protein|uniref:Cyclic lactone autoinducer peptide n=1 Tax=Agathobacter rectalis TaxID=39491 RepID=A0A3E4EFN6_9FIRM|nr:cyclic lactone autoinducer peptide [Agathobacter rectalis]RGI70002.1 cyclic lactone autoinducer peptide [Agathobacter rectalis]RGT13762.1 cyclic lactone autoinducer peptide [Agathobacter rectalis]RGT21501.1 cyclic lactone autoinducer peptide [Agathobacter rectalis]RGZ88919.1 cyclic lactone autoinducer peptide [Agathobacter rectalis]RHE34701.1 cyclic lactone autoinducer peptide [Agathobacter rectalis]
MNMKNVKAQSAKALANVSLKLGKVSVDSACCYIFHQPKVPKDLKKLKKI